MDLVFTVILSALVNCISLFMLVVLVQLLPIRWKQQLGTYKSIRGGRGSSAPSCLMAQSGIAVHIRNRPLTLQESSCRSNTHTRSCACTYIHIYTWKSCSGTRAAEGSASSLQHEAASLMAADMVWFPSLRFLSPDSFQAAGQVKAL